MIAAPYLLFLGAEDDRHNIKTASGVARWRPQDCVGQLRMDGCTLDLGLPDLTPEEAVRQGVRTLVIGVVNFGGVIDPRWEEPLERALVAGLDIAAGLHVRLNDNDRLSRAARAHGRTLHDIRQPTTPFPVGSGRKRSGRRLLTVGTDCAVGKMYASLAITREMQARGIDADFRATGQTGIFIAGSGICVDAVVSDFISGATEQLSPDAAPDHWDIVEGQGSLFHPAYAGVTLGLVHGSQPDAMVLCHDLGRTTIDGYPDYPIRPLTDAIETYLAAARLTNGGARFVGACFNTSSIADEDAARAALARAAQETGLPCCDPVRTGVAPIVDALTG
ncbi:MAG: N-acetyltransferase DgcN [Sphingopyxis sp.]|uniref:N-acetyltransferase DgcN n=1 Tax=Sphingopyxis sp. TaxID=1908224 RepID=UPI002ABA3A68|nr:N-acetyltransferase DgcN [Sphingopyxis sp.]MDZ3832226.1 N-acetyltransferase DgcN [Sphingopyxis sp.]